jgi:hypothetical protein
VFRVEDVVEMDFARNVVVVINGSGWFWCRFVVVTVVSSEDQLVN